MRIGQYQRPQERIGRLRMMLQREITHERIEDNRARMRRAQTGRRVLGPPVPRPGFNAPPSEPYSELFARQRQILGTQEARPQRFDIPSKSFGERLATSKLLTEPVFGESTGERVRSIPVVGPALERNVVPLTTAPGLAATALFPGATLYGAGAATAGSLAGQEAERLGAPRDILGTGIGTRSVAEGVAGLYGGPGGGVKRAATTADEAALAAQRTIEESGGVTGMGGRLAREEIGGTELPRKSGEDFLPNETAAMRKDWPDPKERLPEGIWYHGTTRDFTDFQTEGIGRTSKDWTAEVGVHFAEEPQTAQFFAEGAFGPQQAGRVIPARLRITNPRVYPDEMLMADDAVRAAVEKGVLTRADVRKVPDVAAALREGVSIEDAVDSYGQLIMNRVGKKRPSVVRAYREWLHGQGHDGIVYQNQVEGGTSAIALNPKQIVPESPLRAAGDAVPPQDIEGRIVGETDAERIARNLGAINPSVRGRVGDVEFGNRPPAPPQEPPVGAVGEPPPEPPTRTYVADLRPLAPEEVGGEGVVRKAASKTGVDPSASITDPVAKIGVAFKRQVVAAKNMATLAVDAALEPFYGKLGRFPFSIDNSARITNIEGEPTAWMDVFSNPDAYNLSDGQRAYVDRFLQVVKETEDMRVANGLPGRSIEQAVEDTFYVPRQVMESRGVQFSRPSKASLQRIHETGEQGIEAGARYDRDPLRTLKYHVDAAYQEVAAKQLSDSLEPFSRAPSEVRPDATGELARASESAPGELFGREGNISVKLWRNRFFPKEQAEFLDSIIDKSAQQGWLTATAAKAGNYVRFLSASLDLAAPFIHGLPVMGNDPRRWAIATARHYQAFIDPAVRARYMAANLADFQEMARYGIPVNEHEFFRAIQEGGGITVKGVPGPVRRGVTATGRQTFGRGQAAFDTYAAVARHQLWQGLKDAIADPVERATLVRNMTGGQVTTALGVKGAQQSAEGIFLAFSPALLRSTASLFVKAAQPNTPAGRQALRSLLTLAAGVTTSYVAIGKLLGKSDEEIKQGLDPTGGKKFLAYKVGNDWIGLGGQVRAMVQLAAGVGSAVAPGGQPASSLLSNDLRENPIGQAYLSRGAVGANLGGVAIESASGGNLNTSPYESPRNLREGAQIIGTAALPFSVQGALEGQAPGTVAAGFLGMRTSRETKWEALQAAWEKKYPPDKFPDTPFNLMAAREDPDLKPFVAAWESDRRSKRTPAALKAQEIEQVRANLEVKSGLATQPNGTPGLAAQFLSGNTEVGPQIVDAYDDLKQQMIGTFESTYIDSKQIKASTKDEQLLAQLNSMNSKQAPYMNFETGEIDYDRLDADREKLIGQLSNPVKVAYKAFESRAIDEDWRKLEPQLKQARDLRSELYDKPKYEGLSPEMGDELRDFLREVDAETYLAKANINEDVTSVQVAQALAQKRGEPVLGALAVKALREELPLSVSTIRYALENQDILARFFPGTLASFLPIKIERSGLVTDETRQAIANSRR